MTCNSLYFLCDLSRVGIFPGIMNAAAAYRDVSFVCVRPHEALWLASEWRLKTCPSPFLLVGFPDNNVLRIVQNILTFSPVYFASSSDSSASDSSSGTNKGSIVGTHVSFLTASHPAPLICPIKSFAAVWLTFVCRIPKRIANVISYLR